MPKRCLAVVGNSDSILPCGLPFGLPNAASLDESSNALCTTGWCAPAHSPRGLAERICAVDLCTDMCTDSLSSRSRVLARLCPSQDPDPSTLLFKVHKSFRSSLLFASVEVGRL